MRLPRRNRTCLLCEPPIRGPGRQQERPQSAPSTADAQNRTCQSAYSAIKSRDRKPQSATDSQRSAHHRNSAGELLGRKYIAHHTDTQRNDARQQGLAGFGRQRGGITLELRAPTTEPVTNSAMLIRSRRRLPNMSPKRPMVGTATAAASSVAVTAHAVSDAGAFRYSGRCGMIGMTSVCMSETTMPENARTATTAVVAGDFVVCGGVVGGGEVVDDIAVNSIGGRTNNGLSQLIELKLNQVTDLTEGCASDRDEYLRCRAASDGRG